MKLLQLITTLIICSVMGTAMAEPQAQWTNALIQHKSSLLNKVSTPQVNSNHEAVSFSYKLDSTRVLNFDEHPHVENSRQFWLDSTGNKLMQGINLPVTGGETIIRVSPLSNNKSIQLKAADIQIKNNGIKKAINVFADASALKATGAAFSDQSIALKINADAGKLNLKIDTVADDTAFVVHVLEKDSPYVLSLKSSQATFAANQMISISTEMHRQDKKLNTQLQGYINRPDGSVLGELNFSQEKTGSYVAQIEPQGEQGLAQGLWEVHVFAKSISKGTEIMRDAQTSFAVNLNTAEFTSQVKATDNGIEVGINVGLEGRYEVRGILMGTNKSGNLQAIGMTMAADWLSNGKQSITLPIDSKLIKQSNLSAPYSIKNIQLTNQTYLAPVQTVKSGIELKGVNLIGELDRR